MNVGIREGAHRIARLVVTFHCVGHAHILLAMCGLGMCGPVVPEASARYFVGDQRWCENGTGLSGIHSDGRTLWQH